jgi:hypothetical protein
MIPEDLLQQVMNRLEAMPGGIAYFERPDALVKLAHISAEFGALAEAHEVEETSEQAGLLLKAWSDGEEPLRKAMGSAFIARARAVVDGKIMPPNGAAGLMPKAPESRMGRFRAALKAPRKLGLRPGAAFGVRA